MNIFTSLKHYATKWEISAERAFTDEEINSVKQAVVVPSKYGSSVQFTLTTNELTFIPLAQDATVGTGELVDMHKAKLLTLSKSGENDINRVMI